ncbi:zinc finger protein [Cinnamomum micranthum f. kanehirae]|uniref:Zinc finger protein n=1 Tax=Cinnamomum micranthum f. kanehirae TaxID=337451 RepID=A0A443P0U1_9MAGN|nr:zinc finger protein [Cinnamomum micranthum f. kanehirae]
MDMERGVGGTEAFPELGQHCQQSSCNQLDFLPFKCDACTQVFCLEHRSYKSHNCPKAEQKSRTVVVCSLCSMSMERVGVMEEEEVILEQHVRSGDCNPSNKKKPRCPVKRCKQVLTFSNTTTCKICSQKVCLSHRFPSDHACNKPAGASLGSKFLLALDKRSAKECGQEKIRAPPGAPSVKAF